MSRSAAKVLPRSGEDVLARGRDLAQPADGECPAVGAPTERLCPTRRIYRCRYVDCLETFGADSIVDMESPVVEAFLAEASIASG